MTELKKDTIYIDVDDEITSIIGKVRRSPRNIIALVLPKRAAVLQSIVNMKLLKREADEGKKSIVLITSEAAILPLAGAAKLHVAKTPSSKPDIPPSPQAELEAAGIEEVEIDSTKPVGELADGSSEENIDVDYGDSEESTGEKATANKKLKIPNFERFRLIIMLGGALLIALICFSVWAVAIAPKAKITIKTDTSDVDTKLDFTASPLAKTLDPANMIMPVTLTENKKTDNQKVPATGQKNNGTKATGTVSLQNCSTSLNTVTVPSGTSLTSNGLAFITQSDIQLPATSKNGLNQCTTPTKDVNVTASQGGDKYNLSARNYTVTGFSNVSGAGSNMTGGTSKLVKAVGQSDVDTAKDQILNRLKGIAATELKKQLSDQHMFVLSDSITAKDVAVSANPAVGAEGDQTTVTVHVTYTVMAVSEDNLKLLIEKDVKLKIDPSTQTILDMDNGLSNAVVKLGDKAANGDQKVNLQTTVTAGPQLDAAAIKKEIAGKKKGDSADIIKSRPGIKDVQINYSPFWVSSTPKKTSKITVVFEKANGK